MKFNWRDGAHARTVEIHPDGDGRYRVIVDGAQHDVVAQALGHGRLRLANADGSTLVEVTRDGDRRFVRFGSLDYVLQRESEGARRRRGGQGGLEAPMPGTVTKVMVGAGDAVEKGQPLVALEAMKMEHVVRAPRAGTIKAVAVEAGQMVDSGVAVVELDEA